MSPLVECSDHNEHQVVGGVRFGLEAVGPTDSDPFEHFEWVECPERHEVVVHHSEGGEPR